MSRILNANFSKLASLMNGSIALESTPGVGTKATFTVPFKIHSRSRTLPVPVTQPSNLEIRHHHNLSEDVKWTQPLARRPISKDPLKTQITTTIRSVSPHSPEESKELKELKEYKEPKESKELNEAEESKEPKEAKRVPPADAPNDVKLLPEQRHKTHILVVEDK